jgi:hypothetical protein
MMTGEIIVTGISNSGKESYLFEKPMIIIAVALPNQKPNMVQEVTIMLRDWMEFSDEEYYIIPKKAVMCIMKPNKNIIADYSQAKIQSVTASDMIENRMTDDNNTSKDSKKKIEDCGDDDVEYEEGHDEFPGWGGDPRLD